MRFSLKIASLYLKKKNKWGIFFPMIGEIIKRNKEVQPNSLFLEKLKKAVPEVFDKNGTFDKTAFDALLDENKINTKGENFHLKFLGESYARFISSLDTETVIRETDDSLNVKSENAYIIGDNLDALKHLRKAYSGKVNFIYIDPPYNTGNDDDFVYCDKFVLTRDQLIDKLGVSEKEADLILNLEGKSSHSAWCTFMYPRLKLAHDLLSDDGVIFVSIDDNEMADLKLLLDSIFGESCFYGELIQLKGNTQNDSKSIQKNHEYILCYVKTNQDLLLTYGNEVYKEVYEDEFYLGRDTGASSGHDKLIERANLGYTVYYYEQTGNGATGNHNKLIERANHLNNKFGEYNYYINKSGDKFIHAIAIKDYDQNKITAQSKEEDVYNDVQELLDAGYVKIRPPKRVGNKLGRWTWDIDTFKKYWNNNEVIIKNQKNIIKKEIVDEKEIVTIKGKKYYIKHNTLPFQSIIDIGNAVGTSILQGNDGLIPGVGFNNPKNPFMIKKLIDGYKYNSDNSSSIVLDFFSGSATTADAVMSYNAEHPDKHLKYIMVQLPEVISPKKAAYEMGFRTIDEIGRERIRRVKEKLIKEYGDKIKGVDLDFKTFRIEKFPQNTLDKLEEFDINEQNLTAEAESMFDDSTIITTYKLQDGFSLVNSREKLTLNNAEYVYRVKDDEKECIYITAALSSESIRLLLEKLENYEISPTKIVVYGYALAFSEKTELEVNLKSIRRKGINDNILEIRY